jgi:uncharacterized protein (TIGR03435 family)
VAIERGEFHRMRTEPVVRNYRRRLFLAVACLSLAAPEVIAAQTPAIAPIFEVATIKPTAADARGGSIMMSRDKFETEGQPLRALIIFAYNLNFGSDQQISGGPAWVGSTRFNIDAKEDADTVAALQKLSPEERGEKTRAMLQALLADRFKLKIHHETKVQPVYEMSVVKGGSKLKPSVEPPPPPVHDDVKPSEMPAKPRANGDPNAPGGPPAPPPGWHGLRMGRGEMEARGATTEMFSSVLGHQPEIGGRLVVNKTGLTGKYDFTLKWTPDAGMGAPPPGDTGAPAEPAGPALFTALQEQLGLKLEATKDPVDTLVIDSVEMPSEN